MAKNFKKALSSFLAVTTIVSTMSVVALPVSAMDDTVEPIGIQETFALFSTEIASGDNWSVVGEENALEVTINVTVADQVRNLLNTAIAEVEDATLDDIVKVTIIGAAPIDRKSTRLNSSH